MGFDKHYRHVKSQHRGDFQESIMVLEGTFTVPAGAGTPYSVVNPLGTEVIVNKVVVKLTGSISSTPVTMNVGIGASAAGDYDTLIDGAEVGTPEAAVLLDNIDDQGTNGKASEVWGATEYLTAVVSATPTGLTAGKIYIYYTKPA
jgi:hypothetical protein